VAVAAREHPKEFWIVVHQPVIEHSLARQLMKHDAVRCGELVNCPEGIQLICDVFRGAEIGHQLILALVSTRHGVIVEIDRDAARAAVNIDAGISEPEPLVESARKRSLRVQVLESAMNKMSGLHLGHRELGLDAKQLAKRIDL